MPYRADEAFRYLERAHARARLAHAFLVTSESIRQAEQFLLRCIGLLTGARAERIADLRHPGVHVVKPESLSRTIKVDQVRALESFAHLGSAPGCLVRVGVIHEADRLGEKSENALLKTLEEPPAGLHLFLTSSQPDRLLPTTRSRCVRIDLFGPDREPTGEIPARASLDAIAGYLAEPGRSASAALHHALRMAGELGAVRKGIEERNQKLYRAEVDAYGKTTDGTWLKDREEYYKGLTRADYLRERDLVVTALLSFVGEAIRCKAGAGPRDARPEAVRMAEQERLDSLLRRYADLDVMRAQFETTVNENLVLEAGFIRALA
jgi:DNA polymerase-3 subunit delta'